LEKQNWKKYALEFLSIFIAVISAFALNNWNENRRDNLAEQKILVEISNGLKKDIEDLQTNVGGHKQGIRACQTFRGLALDQPVRKDSFQYKYIALTRDFTTLQNVSGYETLKSRGLELIDNDSLRYELISLYEYDYYTLKKLEESYEEMQFQKSYFKEINALLAPKFIYGERGNILDIETPVNLSKKEKNLLLSYLMKIELNRVFILRYYQGVEGKIKNLEARIQDELNGKG
jgi:hypothetical protein